MGNQYNRSVEFVLCPYIERELTKMRKAKNEVVTTNGIVIEETTRQLPRMKSIQEVMEETGFSYRHLWNLCRANKIVHIRAGAKYLINFDKFIDYLNTGDTDK